QQLESATGQSGFAQRSTKQNFKNAHAPATEELLADEFRSSSGTSTDSPTQRPAAILHVGTQTLYRRGTLLMTPEAAIIDGGGTDQTIQTIDRFSDEYFALIERNTLAENALF